VAAKFCERLKGRGALTSRKLLGDHNLYFWLASREVYRAVGLPYRYHQPTERYLRHKHLINEARLYLEERLGLYSLIWYSDRYLRRDDCPFEYEYRPDGVFVRLPGDEQQPKEAIEAERTGKWSERLETILEHHLDAFERVYYFCNHPETFAKVRAVGDLLDRRREKLTITLLGV